MKMNVQAFFRAVLAQDAQALRAFFQKDAVVEWPCTNERFALDEYIRANCEYPGEWDGELERVVETPDGLIMACRVYPKNGRDSFHAVSFVKLDEGKIASMTEYWADDGPAPLWRQAMQIGTPIK